jgi:hypothetical protein
MWCKHCRQDVPAIAAAELPAAEATTSSSDRSTNNEESHRFLCARCGEPIGSVPPQWTNVSDLGIDLSELSLSASSAKKMPLSNHKTSAPNAAARAEAWQWELDQHLHDVRRLLKRRGASAAEIDWRVDNAEEPSRPVLQVPMAQGFAAAHSAATRAERPPKSYPRPWSPLAWLVLMAGLTASCCGGALMGWSILSARDELWSQGVPILIFGQVALFLALVAMLLRLGRQSQLTATRLGKLDAQLATLGVPSPHESAQSSQHPFYVHLAEGAAPHALLSDLKNQLDLLAIRMSRPNT